MGARGQAWRRAASFLAALTVVALGLVVVTSASGVDRAGAAASTTHAYGATSDETLTVHPGSGRSPLVVLVHGGGWVSHPGVFLATQAADLQAAGFAVFDVNYDSLVRGTGAFPLEVNDVVAATGWAIAHAAQYGADPKNVEMVGGSAGGQLVAMATEEINAFRPQTIRALVTLSGALDFVSKMQDIQRGIVTGYFALHSQLALACSLDAKTCTVPLETEWSPARLVTSTNCPGASLIINGNNEPEPVDQANNMTFALDARHCAVTEVIRDGSQHSFAYWSSVKSEVASFLALH